MQTATVMPTPERVRESATTAQDARVGRRGDPKARVISRKRLGNYSQPRRACRPMICCVATHQSTIRSIHQQLTGAERSLLCPLVEPPPDDSVERFGCADNSSRIAVGSIHLRS